MDLSSLIICRRHLPVSGDVAASCCSLCRKEQPDKASLRLGEDGCSAGPSKEGRSSPPTRYVHRSVKQVYEPNGVAGVPACAVCAVCACRRRRRYTQVCEGKREQALEAKGVT